MRESCFGIANLNELLRCGSSNFKMICGVKILALLIWVQKYLEPVKLESSMVLCH